MQYGRDGSSHCGSSWPSGAEHGGGVPVEELSPSEVEPVGSNVVDESADVRVTSVDDGVTVVLVVETGPPEVDPSAVAEACEAGSAKQPHAGTSATRNPPARHLHRSSNVPQSKSIWTLAPTIARSIRPNTASGSTAVSYTCNCAWLTSSRSSARRVARPMSRHVGARTTSATTARPRSFTSTPRHQHLLLHQELPRKHPSRHTHRRPAQPPTSHLRSRPPKVHVLRKAVSVR